MAAVCMFIALLVDYVKGIADAGLIWTITFNAAAAFALLATMLYYGSEANTQFTAHKAVLLKVQFLVRELLFDHKISANGRAGQMSTSAERDALQRSDRLIDR